MNASIQRRIASVFISFSFFYVGLFSAVLNLGFLGKKTCLIAFNLMIDRILILLTSITSGETT